MNTSHNIIYITHVFYTSTICFILQNNACFYIVKCDDHMVTFKYTASHLYRLTH